MCRPRIAAITGAPIAPALRTRSGMAHLAIPVSIADRYEVSVGGEVRLQITHLTAVPAHG